MDLSALKELIGNIGRLSGSRQLILFGSSSLFASFHSEAPEKIGVETTLDADFFLDPDDDSCRAILIAEFGREQDYHLAHGFYADFVDLRLADAFPKGWRERLVPMPGFTNVVALHPMDMAVSKVNLPLVRGSTAASGDANPIAVSKTSIPWSHSSAPVTSMPRNSPIKYSNSNANPPASPNTPKSWKKF